MATRKTTARKDASGTSGTSDVDDFMQSGLADDLLAGRVRVPETLFAAEAAP